MTFSHTIEISPAFHDLDLMHVVWHGNYIKYFEIARCALMAKLNYDYPEMKESGYAWPVIDLNVRYSHAITYGQVLLVTAAITEWENRLKVTYRIHDKATGKLLTKGHTIQVAVDFKRKEMCFVSPDIVFEKLGQPKP